MLKPIALANTLTVVTAVFYIVCALLSYLAPDLLLPISQSWVHMLNLSPLRTTAVVDLPTLLLGIVSLSAVVWITTYAAAELYNRLARK